MIAKQPGDPDLRESDDIFRRALEFARVGFFRYRFDGAVLEMDRVALELLDLADTMTPDDVVGKQIGELLVYVGPPGRLRETLREQREVRGFEYPYRTLSGQERCVLHNSFVVEDAETGDEVIQVICVDATELRLARQRLQELNRELEERVARRTAELELANGELRSFAYSVSHDLRTPLRAMDGFSVALLEDFGDQLNDTGRDYLQRIRRGCRTMSGLIDGLLRLSRVGQHELDRRPVNLSAVATATMDRLRATAPHRILDFEVAPGLVVSGDPDLVELVLENLLGNAFKFTAPKPSARIQLGVREIDGSRVFFVADNGVGFDREYEPKLFRIFERLHPAEEYEGSGVGLATVKRIVERHGGRVWGRGVAGEGATFFFTLEP